MQVNSSTVRAITGLFDFVLFTWQHIIYQQAFMFLLFFSTLLIRGEFIQYNMTFFWLPLALCPMEIK